MIGLPVVLLVSDFFHPLHGIAVGFLLDRDVGHGGGGRRGFMPMLFARGKPDHIARTEFFERGAAFAAQAQPRPLTMISD